MKRSLLLMIAGLLFWTSAVTGATPQLISYQGILRNADGTIVPNGSYQLTFKIYTVPSSGTALWTETQTLTITNGVCNALLGSVTTLALPFDQQYWLGVTIGLGVELIPRLRLASVPYARRAAVADSLAGGSVSDSDWIVVGDDMHSGVTGSVGIGTATPDASALLELSGTRGLLLPRMTQAERDAIQQPKDGLLIFNSDTNCINYYAAGVWLTLCGSCVPDCAGKQCGSDGCGGSCGTCPTGTHCENFQCVCDVDECTASQSYCDGLVHHGCVENSTGCGHWVVEDCDDGNPCTTDSCSPTTGCTHTPLPSGTSCGTGMICINGTCQSCSNSGGSTCGLATAMGTVCGDLGGDVLVASGCGSGWFRVVMQECDTTPFFANDLTMRVDLQSPELSDYDLYIYSPCGTEWDRSTNGVGQMDTVDVLINDSLTSDQTTTFYVEVRLHSIANSASWQMWVRGNQ